MSPAHGSLQIIWARQGTYGPITAELREPRPGVGDCAILDLAGGGGDPETDTRPRAWRRLLPKLS